MLLQRTLTALLLAPLVILAVLLLPTPWFAPLLGMVLLAAMWEWTRLSGMRRLPLRVVLITLAALLLGLLWHWRTSWAVWPLLIVLGVIWWGGACLWLRHFAFAAAPTPENCRLKLLAGLLVIVPAWIAVLYLHNSEQGHGWTLLALMLVWAADVGAYFSGSLFGRKKLAAQISPGKTWAGVYGALACGVLVALIGGHWLEVQGLRMLSLVLLALLTVLASVVGDLTESLLKRHAQIKDSGHLFPGHGGLLDRLDGVFAALPVFVLGKTLFGL